MATSPCINYGNNGAVVGFWTPFWTPLPDLIFAVGTISWYRFVYMAPSKHLRVNGAKYFQSIENR
jgi:hypothetical protein